MEQCGKEFKRQVAKGDQVEKTHSALSVAGFELFESGEVVIDQSETIGKSTTEFGAEPKEDNVLGISFVHLAELLRKFSLRHVGATMVDDFDELGVRKETNRTKSIKRERDERKNEISRGFRCKTRYHLSALEQGVQFELTGADGSFLRGHRGGR